MLRLSPHSTYYNFASSARFSIDIHIEDRCSVKVTQNIEYKCHWLVGESRVETLQVYVSTITVHHFELRVEIQKPNAKVVRLYCTYIRDTFINIM